MSHAQIRKVEGVLATTLSCATISLRNTQSQGCWGRIRVWRRVCPEQQIVWRITPVLVFSCCYKSHWRVQTHHCLFQYRFASPLGSQKQLFLQKLSPTAETKCCLYWRYTSCWTASVHFRYQTTKIKNYRRGSGNITFVIIVIIDELFLFQPFESIHIMLTGIMTVEIFTRLERTITFTNAAICLRSSF